MLATLQLYFQQLVDFVRDHEAWAAPVVFALAFGESLAFISLLVPAWGALVGIGYLIGPSGISFWPVCVAGALGAALGDWLSYWIGVKVRAPAAPSVAARRALYAPLGHCGNLHRPFLRAVARLGAACRRNSCNAVLALPVRQFH